MIKQKVGRKSFGIGKFWWCWMWWPNIEFSQVFDICSKTNNDIFLFKGKYQSTNLLFAQIKGFPAKTWKHCIWTKTTGIRRTHKWRKQSLLLPPPASSIHWLWHLKCEVYTNWKQSITAALYWNVEKANGAGAGAGAVVGTWAEWWSRRHGRLASRQITYQIQF